jgi:hypothetical protein
MLTKCGELSGKCKVDALGQFVELILSSSSDNLARISHLLGSGALSEQHQAECDGSSSSSVAILRFKRRCAARLCAQPSAPLCGEPHNCPTGLAVHLGTAESRSLRSGQLHQVRELVRVHGCFSNTTETHTETQTETYGDKTDAKFPSFLSLQVFRKQESQRCVPNTRGPS